MSLWDILTDQETSKLKSDVIIYEIGISIIKIISFYEWLWLLKMLLDTNAKWDRYAVSIVISKTNEAYITVAFPNYNSFIIKLFKRHKAIWYNRFKFFSLLCFYWFFSYLSIKIKHMYKFLLEEKWINI